MIQLKELMIDLYELRLKKVDIFEIFVQFVWQLFVLRKSLQYTKFVKCARDKNKTHSKKVKAPLSTT